MCKRIAVLVRTNVILLFMLIIIFYVKRQQVNKPNNGIQNISIQELSLFKMKLTSKNYFRLEKNVYDLRLV